VGLLREGGLAARGLLLAGPHRGLDAARRHVNPETINEGDSPLPKPVRSGMLARNRRDLADGWVGEVMRHWAALAIALVLSAAASAPAGAETINIVAFGDSGVFGSGQGRTHGGVPVAEAYPAKLERALRARGWDVSVSNQGVRGATARNAVYTIDRSVPPLTKVTIIQFGSNDRGLLLASAGDIAQSLEEIIRRVRAKGSAVILVRQWPASDAAAERLKSTPMRSFSFAF
jgi:lysophospholipase L1-like esterase